MFFFLLLPAGPTTESGNTTMMVTISTETEATTSFGIPGEGMRTI